MINLWQFRLGLLILAVGVGIGFSMIIGHPLGDYISGALIGLAGGFNLGLAYKNKKDMREAK